MSSLPSNLSPFPFPSSNHKTPIPFLLPYPPFPPSFHLSPSIPHITTQGIQQNSQSPPGHGQSIHPVFGFIGLMIEVVLEAAEEIEGRTSFTGVTGADVHMMCRYILRDDLVIFWGLQDGVGRLGIRCLRGYVIGGFEDRLTCRIIVMMMMVDVEILFGCGYAGVVVRKCNKEEYEGRPRPWIKLPKPALGMGELRPRFSSRPRRHASRLFCGWRLFLVYAYYCCKGK